MTVKELVEIMGLTVFCGQENLDREIKGGYTSDLLSDVMGYLCPRPGTVVCDDLAWRDANRTS